MSDETTLRMRRRTFVAASAVVGGHLPLTRCPRPTGRERDGCVSSAVSTRMDLSLTAVIDSSERFGCGPTLVCGRLNTPQAVSILTVVVVSLMISMYANLQVGQLVGAAMPA